MPETWSSYNRKWTILFKKMCYVPYGFKSLQKFVT